MDYKQLEFIENYARERMAELGVYGWPHVERVYRLSLHIAKLRGEQNLDLDALKAAALLHDIAKSFQKRNRGVDHGKIGAEMAENFLKSLGFSEDKIKIVYNAIRAHNKGEKPLSLEAKILCDADFLDKLGAVGIATVFIKACLTKRTIENVAEMFTKGSKETSYVGKHLQWLKEKPRLYTKTGRRLAKRRSKLAPLFFRELENELKLTAI
ncbi:MAG: HD domain-containing protein [Candidatus Bathyarchaeia archaeon]